MSPLNMIKLVILLFAATVLSIPVKFAPRNDNNPTKVLLGPVPTFTVNRRSSVFQAPTLTTRDPPMHQTTFSVLTIAPGAATHWQQWPHFTVAATASGFATSVKPHAPEPTEVVYHSVGTGHLKEKRKSSFWPFYKSKHGAHKPDKPKSQQYDHGYEERSHNFKEEADHDSKKPSTDHHANTAYNAQHHPRDVNMHALNQDLSHHGNGPEHTAHFPPEVADSKLPQFSQPRFAVGRRWIDPEGRMWVRDTEPLMPLAMK